MGCSDCTGDGGIVYGRLKNGRLWKDGKLWKGGWMEGWKKRRMEVIGRVEGGRMRMCKGFDT